MNLHQYYHTHKTKDSVAVSTFRKNVAKGMTLEEAMVTRARAAKTYSKSSDEYKKYEKIAVGNGIRPGTFRQRIKYGWSYEDASTLTKYSNRHTALPTDGHQPRKSEKTMVREIKLLINAGVPIGKKRYVDYIKKHPELFPELGVKS